MRAPLLSLLLAAPALSGCVGGDGAFGIGTTDDDALQGSIAPGWPPLDRALIRPGVTVVSGACTANFVFHTPDNRTLFLGTAAHCLPDREIGDPVSIAGGAVEGRLAYSSFLTMEENGEDIAGNDFALIELPDSARDTVHPAMLGFGGPTGIAETAEPGEKVLVHGNSTARPDGPPRALAPREGYVTEHGPWTTGIYTLGPGIPGDSGSPVVTGDGLALGDVITLEFAPQPASNNVANLAATLAYANANMDRTVELSTWPLLEDGPLPSPPNGVVPDETAPRMR